LESRKKMRTALSVPERLQNGYDVEDEAQVTTDPSPLAARRTATRNGSEADAELQKNRRRELSSDIGDAEKSSDAIGKRRGRKNTSP
jgi:hypothetical protein